MPRLFTAIRLPGEIVSRLAMMRGGLHAAHWVEPENYHLTLRFAGDITDMEANDFADALADIEAESFMLELEGAGSFGGSKPRSIWVGVKPCEPLMHLQKAHERAARRAGLAPETRNFTPHITLARMKYASPLDVADYLSRQAGLFTPPFNVTQFVLYSARAFHGGGPYVAEQIYDLRRPGEDSAAAEE